MLVMVVLMVILLPHPFCGEADSMSSPFPFYLSITPWMIPSEDAAKKQKGSTQKLISFACS